eukprot:2026982-Alexandrium_andersonii.AAC.1
MQGRGQADLPLATQSALMFGSNILATRPSVLQTTPNTVTPTAFAPPPVRLAQPPPTRDHRTAERGSAPANLRSPQIINGAQQTSLFRSSFAGFVGEAAVTQVRQAAPRAAAPFGGSLATNLAAAAPAEPPAAPPAADFDPAAGPPQYGMKPPQFAPVPGEVEAHGPYPLGCTDERYDQLALRDAAEALEVGLPIAHRDRHDRPVRLAQPVAPAHERARSAL